MCCRYQNCIKSIIRRGGWFRFCIESPVQHNRQKKKKKKTGRKKRKGKRDTATLQCLFTELTISEQPRCPSTGDGQQTYIPWNSVHPQQEEGTATTDANLGESSHDIMPHAAICVSYAVSTGLKDGETNRLQQREDHGPLGQGE